MTEAEITPFVCGRYIEDGAGRGPFAFAEPHLRDDGSCSYCGSISEEAFFEAAEAGCLVTPTDKTYKVYVDMPNPQKGELRVVSCMHGEERPSDNWEPADPAILKRDGWRETYDWMLRSPHGDTKHAKFYFQHLSEEGKHRFIAMLNEKKLVLATPGYFYVPPYFVSFK